MVHCFSYAMNLQKKCNCIQIVYETCSKIFMEVHDFEKTCNQINDNLDLKIENCKSDLSLNKKKR